jgi:hypothetical protein
MTTTYTFEQLKEDVTKEAEALRVHATKEERERLDFETLQPSNGNHCIYGQLCGVCDNDRAVELISACAPVMYRQNRDGFCPTDKSLITSRWSPIEAYVCQAEANNANLISYLRGETETLTL